MAGRGLPARAGQGRLAAFAPVRLLVPPHAAKGPAGRLGIHAGGQGMILNDTSPEAQRVLDDVFCRLPLPRKWELLRQAQRRGRLLEEAGRRLRHPGSALMSETGEDVEVLRRVVAA